MAVAEAELGRESCEDNPVGKDRNPYRDPCRAKDRIRFGIDRHDNLGSASARPLANTAKPFVDGIGIYPEIRADVFTEGTANLEHRNGAEHDTFFDPSTARVVKLTQPGKLDGIRDLEQYLQRLALSNEFFDDDILIEGWLRYPNEDAQRLISSQPWHRLNPQHPEPSLAEIDAFMDQGGWLKAHDGAWFYNELHIVATHALPKSFVVDVAGHIHAIGVILTISPEEWGRLSRMASKLPPQ